MGDNSRSNSNVLLHIQGFTNVCRTCKSFLSKCYQEKNPAIFLKNIISNKPKTQPIQQDDSDDDDDDTELTEFEIHVPSEKHHGVREDQTGYHNDDDNNNDEKKIKGFSGLTRNLSHGWRSHTLNIPTFSKSKSHRDAPSATFTHSLPRSTSRGAAAPIIFSNSSGIMKPPVIEKHLECTLEELCFGGVKKASITKDVVKDNGQIEEEEETMMIRVEPGWRKGTKIAFKGKGNQRPGTEAADVIFVIAEEEHSVFKREDDDLQLGVEILLVEALTGGPILLPLLGGEMTSLVVEEIVHPGYELVIEGEGMPKQNDAGRRGDLIVNISVKFPEALTEDQRSRAAAILQQPC